MIYVTSDIHGYFTLFKNELDKQGFNPNRDKLIICGDLLDRGYEPRELIDYLLSLPKENLILIRGNHEDLFDNCLEELVEDKIPSSHHVSNGTLMSIRSLVGDRAILNGDRKLLLNQPYIRKFKELESRMVDYYEVDKYIFVHGFIPCISNDFLTYYQQNKTLGYNENWRQASETDWSHARWVNGIDSIIKHKLNKTNKTIVCGHWHCSHAWNLVKNTPEFGEEAVFNPYISKDLIALDACTAYSGKVNIVKLEEGN